MVDIKMERKPKVRILPLEHRQHILWPVVEVRAPTIHSGPCGDGCTCRWRTMTTCVRRPQR